MARVEIGWGELYQIIGGWRLRIVGSNGEIIAYGESYVNKADAVAALRALVGNHEVREVQG